MSRTLRIGLTGGVASGKSTAAHVFAALGVPVIDADEAARAVVAPGTPGLSRVIERFGAHLTAPDGTLDRRALRRLIFADPGARADLESILHPLIRAEMERRSREASGPYQVFAIPLLVEGGAIDRVDRILVIDSPERLQIERLVARDRVTEAEGRAMLAAQASRSARLAAADDVIENSGSVEELREAIRGLHARYLALASAGAHPAD